MSSTLGSPTNTCWKRRSSAGSFSMFSRYSSSVVAPIRRSSPRASIGLSMLPASIEPSAAPAPTIVWISSMNVMICPSDLRISSSTLLRRSSNSPRYLEPATMDPRSRLIRRLFCSVLGTSPATMRSARPSTTAVLPTPGSPISTGLFLVRRLRIWITRRISWSRPITGSSLPSRARAVRSVENFSSALYEASASGLVTLAPPRTCGIASRILSAVTPLVFRIFAASFGVASAMPSSRCSVETYSSPISFIAFSAAAIACVSWRLACGCAVDDPEALGSATRALRTAAPICCAFAPHCSMRPRITPFS